MARLPDATERLGVAAVDQIFTQMGWIFREQPIRDYGIDAQAEAIQDGTASGRLIALQIKSGASHFRVRGDGFVYYGEERHRTYWANHSLPVFIILHDPDKGLTLWQRVQEHLIEQQSAGRWSIQIPAANTLDKEHEHYLLAGIATDLNNIRRQQLALDLPLIKRVAEEETVYLRVQEWVNKTLNFRGSEFVFSDVPDDPAEFEMETWLPARTFERFMSVVFPWLSYSEYSYDDESGSGEVTGHTARVELSDLGKAMLMLEEYYEDGAATDEDERPEPSFDTDFFLELGENDRDLEEDE